MSRNIRKFRTDKLDVNQTRVLAREAHVNGWKPAVYMRYMSQNFRLFRVSNLSVPNFRIFLLKYPGALCRTRRFATAATSAPPRTERDENGVIKFDGLPVHGSGWVCLAAGVVLQKHWARELGWGWGEKGNIQAAAATPCCFTCIVCDSEL